MFRDTTSDADMPMTKIMREFPRPRIEVEQTDYGLRLNTLRQISDDSMHVRITNLVFPNAFMIPMSQEMTISQWHVPIDDTTHYWYCIFTSFGSKVDKDEMRRQRLELYELPNYMPRKNKQQRLRLRSARAGARDLYRHGRRHQRARPMGLRVDGRRFRIAPRSISASPTRRSPPIGACCAPRSSRPARASAR